MSFYLPDLKKKLGKPFFSKQARRTVAGGPSTGEDLITSHCHTGSFECCRLGRECAGGEGGGLCFIFFGEKGRHKSQLKNKYPGTLEDGGHHYALGCHPLHYEFQSS